MTDKTLPQRMREAAKVLEEASRRDSPRAYSGGKRWSPHGLTLAADRFEAEDRVDAEREAMVEELARDLHALNYDPERFGRGESETAWHKHARKLIDAGWGKVTDE